jgi:glycyl-tRNA synthetase
VKAAVLPLVRKDGQPELAREVRGLLRGLMQTEYDEGGSIGRRYRRQDEIGTPWGITVDGQTMEDDTVTLRDRDSLEQARVPIAGLADELELGPRPDRADDRLAVERMIVGDEDRRALRVVPGHG